jgi:hypothetical protein
MGWAFVFHKTLRKKIQRVRKQKVGNSEFTILHCGRGHWRILVKTKNVRIIQIGNNKSLTSQSAVKIG